MNTFNKLKAYGLTALALSLAPLGASAAVDGKADAFDNYSVGYMFDLGYNAAGCGDTSTDLSGCGTLMVSTAGSGTVQFALILPETLKDNTYGTNSTDYDGKDQDFKALTGSDKLIVEMNGNSLTMDFLEGVGDEDDGPVFISGFTGEEGSPTEASKPSWALAAATSMQYNYNASSPDGTNAPTHFGTGANSPGAGDAALAFWEFQHIYEWEVSESIFQGGSFDIAQLSLEDIHLSPKKEDHNDSPPIITCSSGDPSNCLPPGTPPTGTPVPLPGTLVLILTGMGILGGRRVMFRRPRSIARSSKTNSTS